MFRRNNKSIFSGGRISDAFQRNYDSIKATIEGESENYILNVNETEYIEHLESKYKLIAPEIHFDQVYADSYEMMFLLNIFQEAMMYTQARNIKGKSFSSLFLVQGTSVYLTIVRHL